MVVVARSFAGHGHPVSTTLLALGFAAYHDPMKKNN
jgi:hypothetical protein